MKILYVQDTDWIRRNPIQHTHLAERLVQRGHEVRAIDYEILWRAEGKRELYSRRQVFKVSRLLKNADVTVIRPGILKIPVLDYVSMLFTYTKEIKRQIREFQPDVIIGDAILTTFLGYQAARKSDIPTVFYVLDINHRLIPFKFLQSMGKILESKNIRNADVVLAINQGLREYTIQMGADTDRARVLTAGIDPERSNLKLNGKKLREKYGIKDEDLVLFFVGWIHHFNGLKEVIQSLAKEPDERIKLLVVGDGDGYEELRMARDSHQLQDRVILTGRKPYEEVPSFLAAADVCLLPAYPDEPIMQSIVPIKMYDYMGMGKPIIVTKLPGIMREFGDKSGIVYIDRPEDALAAAIKLSKNGALAELGAKSRRFIEKYDWDSITDEFESLLKEAIESKSNG